MKKFWLGSTALVLSAASPAMAAEIVYVGPAIGNWANGANWSTGSVPQAGDTVRVWHGDPVTARTMTYDSAVDPALGPVTVQGSFGAPLTLQHNAGGLTAERLAIGGNTRGHYVLGGTGALKVGTDVELGTFSAGNSLSQSGTSIFQVANDLRIGLVAGSSGEYSLSGGTATVGRGINVGEGGGATLNISGGSLSSALLAIAGFTGSSGQVTLSGGTLQVSGQTYIGAGSGSVAQSGGVLSTGELNFGGIAGSGGTYFLSGGQLNVAGLTQLGSIGSATVFHSGGSHTTGTLVMGNTATGGATYWMSGGQLTLTNQGIALGDGGSGTFMQSGGAVAAQGAQGNVQIGRLAGSNGSYQMSGGTLDVANLLVVGRAGIGELIQSGTSNVTVNTGLSVGALAGGNGTYRLEGGTLLVKGNEAIGNAGTGTFWQSAGTHTVNGSLTVGANGTYNLSGGTLSAGTITNNGKFNYNGAATVNGNVVNNGQLNFNASSMAPKTFTGPITNNAAGVVKLSGVHVEYGGAFTNHGAYEHGPGYTTASSKFTHLNVGATGYLKGGPSPYYRDRFVVGGDFRNASTQAAAWNTLGSTLSFIGAGTHLLQLAGADLGAVVAGYDANFAFGGFFLGVGMTITLEDGNGVPGAAFYVGGFELAGSDLGLLANIQSDFNIYYDSSLLENAYLDGQTYALDGDGWLIAVNRNLPPAPPPPPPGGVIIGQPTDVPEPSALLVLLGGLLGLAAASRRRTMPA